MERIAQVFRRFDAFQERHAVLAFPLAVFKKYSEDQGNNYVALLTYYGFLSLFPLLLLLLTILEIFLASYPELRETILESTLKNFPVLADMLNQNIQALSGTWFRVIFSSIAALLAAFGVANTIRNMINNLWQIPYVSRRGAPWNYLQNMGIILTGGLILGATTLIASWIAGAGSLWYYALALMINFGLFLLGYRIATARQIKTKNLLLQAGLTAIVWQVLQAFGSYLIERELNHLNLLYGSFAVVLGLLFWLYLVARVAVYAIEIDVVRVNRMWPRSISGGITKAGQKAYAGYAKAERRHPNQSISVRFRQRRKQPKPPASDT